MAVETTLPETCGQPTGSRPMPIAYCGKSLLGLPSPELDLVTVAAIKTRRALCIDCYLAWKTQRKPKNDEQWRQFHQVLELIWSGEPVSWRKIGAMMGISGQAAQGRFGAKGYGIILPPRETVYLFHYTTAVSQQQSAFIEDVVARLGVSSGAAIRHILDWAMDTERSLARARSLRPGVEVEVHDGV